MIFCTLFDWSYLAQGLALYRSLERVVKDDFVLYVLCVGDYVPDALHYLNLPNLRLVHLADIENDALRAVRSTRTVGEYCWTCTTPLLLHVLSLHPPDTVVTYVDADLWFYSDPTAVLTEMGDGSIFIHEHDFAPEYADLLASSGRFNVGLAAFRNNEEGLACLRRWYAQCIDECAMDPAAGKCGDQNYLDEWPNLYPGLVISQNPGVGLAPWNVSKRQLGSVKGTTTVDGQPVVFYHFHSLRMLRPRLGFKPVIMASGKYFFDPSVVRTIYEPYARELWRVSSDLDKANFGIANLVPTVPHMYSQLLNHQLIFQIAGFSLPPDRNVQALKTLYGIDAEREML
jgi:hypothetical protein